MESTTSAGQDGSRTHAGAERRRLTFARPLAGAAGQHVAQSLSAGSLSDVAQGQQAGRHSSAGRAGVQQAEAVGLRGRHPIGDCAIVRPPPLPHRTEPVGSLSTARRARTLHANGAQRSAGRRGSACLAWHRVNGYRTDRGPRPTVARRGTFLSPSS